jgi:hypothetical protein
MVVGLLFAWRDRRRLLTAVKVTKKAFATAWAEVGQAAGADAP